MTDEVRVEANVARVRGWLRSEPGETLLEFANRVARANPGIRLDLDGAEQVWRIPVLDYAPGSVGVVRR